jgi:predicted dehydrogenase
MRDLSAPAIAGRCELSAALAPFVVAARHLLDHSIGDIRDIEVRLVANTHWHLRDFMFDVPRAEILYHRIHHIDLIRFFWGNPKGI